MINLETRKKLKELDDKIGLFGDFDCFKTSVCEVGSTTSCPPCEHYLPNPTLEELIEAIDEKIIEQKVRGRYQIEYNPTYKSHPRFYSMLLYHHTGSSKMLTAEHLNQALAEAIIWLYEQEE